MTSRRLFSIHHLSMRWFLTRGWAFGASLMFLVCAAWVAGPYDGWWDAAEIILFVGAAGVLFMLGCFPEHVGWRAAAVGWAWMAAGTRAFGLMFHAISVPGPARGIGVATWFFIAYACWLLAIATAHVPNRGKG